MSSVSQVYRSATILDATTSGDTELVVAAVVNVGTPRDDAQLGFYAWISLTTAPGVTGVQFRIRDGVNVAGLIRVDTGLITGGIAPSSVSIFTVAGTSAAGSIASGDYALTVQTNGIVSGNTTIEAVSLRVEVYS
jgi:hypothetical protein